MRASHQDTPVGIIVSFVVCSIMTSLVIAASLSLAAIMPARADQSPPAADPPPPAAGTLKWTSGYIAGNNFDSAAALGSNGRIYVEKQDGKLYAFTPAGDLKWTFTIGTGMSGMLTAPAIGPDGTIYAASGDGYLYAIADNDTSAVELWQYPGSSDAALSSIYSSPAIGNNGTIYFGCKDDNLYAVTPPASGLAGTLQWTYPAPSEMNSSPAIGADGTIYTATAYGYFYALRDHGTSAALSWRYPATSTVIESIDTSPALGADGTIYFGAGDLNTAYLYALKPDGTLKWEFTTLQGGIDSGSPVIGHDGTIYIGTQESGSTDGRLYAITDNGTSAAKKWDYQIRPEGPNIYGIEDTPAIDTNGTIYFGASDGWLYAVTDTGTAASLKWRFPVTTVYPDDTFEAGIIPSSPLLGADGTVYIGSAEQDSFYAVYGDSQGTATDTTWPTFHYNAGRTGRSLAELSVSAISDPPAQGAPGGTFPVTDTTKNNGGASVQIGAANADSFTGYYLSAAGGATLLPIGTRTVPLIDAWSENTGMKTVTIPANTPEGRYKLRACADASLLMAEIIEDNNCLEANKSIYVGLRPDLAESGNSVSPATVAWGGKIAVMDTVTNRGNIKADPSATYYYLSATPEQNVSAVYLGKRPVPAIKPTNGSKGKKVLVVPPNMLLGSAYILICADGAGKIIESYEDNNCVASSLTLTAPDLTDEITNLSASSVTKGGKITVSDAITNHGSAKSGPSLSRYYLSTTTGTSGAVAVGKRPVPALNPNGGAATGHAIVTIPRTTSPGQYYIIACADSANKVAENDETNNCSHAPLTVN